MQISPNNDKSTPKAPILVMAIGVDSFSQIALRTAFLLHKDADYQLQNTATPNILIIDLDDIEAEQIMQRCKVDYANVPIITLSSDDSNQHTAYSTLQKPIDVEALFPALVNALNNDVATNNIDQIQTAPKQEVVYTKSKTANSNQPTPPSLASMAFEYDSLKSAPTLRHLERCNLYSGLLGQALKHLKRNEDIVFGDGQDPALILLSSEKTFLLLKPLQEIKAICNSETKLQIQKISADHPPLPGVRVKTQALIWQMAIWTANGRLIMSITPDTLLSLRHWPNLTRLAQTPQAIKISAFIIKYPSNLRAINRMLGVPITNILDFISATYATGLLEKTTAKQADAQVTNSTRDDGITDQNNLLSKLLRKVKRT